MIGTDAIGLLDVVFDAFAFAVSSWVVFDTKRALRVLSLDREETLKRWQVNFMRVAGAVVAIGMASELIAALARKL